DTCARAHRAKKKKPLAQRNALWGREEASRGTTPFSPFSIRCCFSAFTCRPARTRKTRKSGQKATPAVKGTLRGYFPIRLVDNGHPVRAYYLHATAFSPALQGHLQWSSPAGFHSPGSLNRWKTTY